MCEILPQLHAFKCPQIIFLVNPQNTNGRSTKLVSRGVTPEARGNQNTRNLQTTQAPRVSRQTGQQSFHRAKEKVLNFLRPYLNRLQLCASVKSKTHFCISSFGRPTPTPPTSLAGGIPEEVSIPPTLTAMKPGQVSYRGCGD